MIGGLRHADMLRILGEKSRQDSRYFFPIVFILKTCCVFHANFHVFIQLFLVQKCTIAGGVLWSIFHASIFAAKLSEVARILIRSYFPEFKPQSKHIFVS